ncbi:MAG: rhodanese-like domain-containing protein [Pseudomonadota bacterium]
MSTIKTWGIVLGALLLVACGPKEDQFIDAKTAADMQTKGSVLLDIRENDSYEELRIPNSLHIPYGRLALRLSELEAGKAKGIVVFDQSGVRAPMAWELLQKAGFPQVRILKGGLNEWKTAGLPVEKPQPPVTEEEVMPAE